nr:MAG TPA: hypothetical protein [Caudoviricetes sp.]
MIRTYTNLYEPIRTYTNLYAPIRTYTSVYRIDFQKLNRKID